MKKFMVVLMGLLFTASAFAQDAKGPQFKYSVWANAFAVTETTAPKDEYKDYSNIRVRPMFTLTNDNVSVVTRFEIDQFYGKGGNTTVGGNGSGSNSGYADPDADQIAVEVKNIYIDVKDAFMPGLSLRAGIAPFVYSVGYNNDMPLFNVVYDAGMFKLDLAYIKVEEADLVEKTAIVDDLDDSHMYSVKLPVKFGDITITPAVLYTVGEESFAGGEFTTTAPSIALSMKSGALSVNSDFVYISGSYDATDVDVAAYAGYVNVGYTVSDALKFNVFGLYATGEDDDIEKTTSFHTASMDEIEVGPMFIINDAGYINQVGISNEYDRATEGLMMFGLGAELKMDKLTVLGQLAYATTTSDELVKDTAIGTELNLRLAYEVAPRTSVWAEFAYLAAGKYIETKNGGENDSPMYYALGVMTSF